MPYLTDLSPKPVGSKAETCCLIHPNLFSSTYCFQLILFSCSPSSSVCRVVLTHFCHNLTSLVSLKANWLWDLVKFVQNDNWNVAVGGWQDECVKFHCSDLINPADMQGLSLYTSFVVVVVFKWFCVKIVQERHHIFVKKLSLPSEKKSVDSFSEEAGDGNVWLRPAVIQARSADV